MAGDAQTGICIMQMEQGLDTGPVLLRGSTPIGAEETTADLHDRLSRMGADLILRALAELPSLPPEAQPTEGITYAQKIDKAEARIDWARPAVEVDRQIRALSPFPGAWCLAGAERLKLLRCRLAAGQGTPGQILRGLTVACGEGAVEITEAQREGKRPASAQDLLRGFDLPARLA
jgi:methionyl-tRNA formyltransferase